MSPPDALVVAAGLAAIAWVNWHFFLSKPAAVGAVAAGDVQEVTIVVEGGYVPALVRARAGRPLRLVFDRRESSGCSEEVVLPDFGVRRFLPAHRKTLVEVRPERPGAYEFTCGMGMLRGRLVVEE